MQEVVELFKSLGVVGWPVAILVSIKWFGVDKKAWQFYDHVIEPWLIKKVNLQEESMRHQLRRYVDDGLASDVLKANYDSIARHLVTSAWRLKVAFAKGDINEEAILKRIRTDAHDVINEARKRLRERLHFETGHRLDKHLNLLDEAQIREFYAPIVAGIADVSEQSKYDYESLRFAVLAEVDAMYGEAVDLVTLEKKKGENNG